MREIKFRGIYPHSGQFFYGDFVQSFPETPRIVTNESSTPVKIETVGQYTGLKDKNGVEIFEGDVVKNYTGFKFPVTFKDGCFMWNNEPLCYDMNDTDNPIYLPEKWAEVCGNIHQHPELLTT